MAIVKNINEETRQAWLLKTLQALPVGARILDAGAGELKKTASIAATWIMFPKISLDTKARGASGRGFANQRLGYVADRSGQRHH